MPYDGINTNAIHAADLVSVDLSAMLESAAHMATVVDDRRAHVSQARHSGVTYYFASSYRLNARDVSARLALLLNVAFSAIGEPRPTHIFTIHAHK